MGLVGPFLDFRRCHELWSAESPANGPQGPQGGVSPWELHPFRKRKVMVAVHADPCILVNIGRLRFLQQAFIA